MKFSTISGNVFGGGKYVKTFMQRACTSAGAIWFYEMMGRPAIITINNNI